MSKRIAIVPARGGSKRVPKKNIRDFCGAPMISHILSAASECGLFDEIHISTDCDEIAGVVEKLGFAVEFRRPASLSDDHTPLMPVLKYVLDEYIKRGQTFDSMTLLMPCSPMITAQDLRGGAALFDAHEGKHAVLSVSEYPCPVEWAFRLDSGGALLPLQPGMFSVRSQDLAPAYYDAGQFCIMPIQRVLAAQGAGNDEGYIGYPIQKYQAIDIDTMGDWEFAELVFNGILKRARST